MHILTTDVISCNSCRVHQRACEQDHDLYLTGTAEIPLGGLFMDKLLNEEQLPIKVAAHGHCFRTEAGAAGAATKGLYRVHQFSKVEMFVVCTPEQSDSIHDELIKIEVRLSGCVFPRCIRLFVRLSMHARQEDARRGVRWTACI